MQYVALDAHLKTSTFGVLDARGRKVMTRTVKGPWAGYPNGGEEDAADTR